MLQKLNYTDEAVINDLLNKEITVFEDVQGSKIYVNWDGNNFSIKPKSLHGESISLLDLATQKYYNKAINFFYALPDRVVNLMPKKWYFCFEYFPDQQPANIEYDREPKNSLILTGICKNGKFKYTIEELIEYANLFKCDYLPIMFKGKLNEIQKTAIKYFLNTSEEDLEYVFGEHNFAYFFYKLLNPLYENSYLMSKSFQDNLQKLIITTNDFRTCFEILNPLYKRVSNNNKTEYAEIYSLILINFMSYIQLVDIENVKLTTSVKKYDNIYIALICNLFNSYITNNFDDIDNFEISIPKFFDKDKFKINTELIENKMTIDYIKDNSKLEYIFKILLSSLNKKRKKPIGIFTDKTVELFNKLVDDVLGKVSIELNKMSEKELRKSSLLNFGDYYDIKYDIDASGDVYPSISSEFEPPSISDKKMKKGYDDSKGDDDFDFEI